MTNPEDMRYHWIVGIDPGLDGGIAAYDGEELMTMEIPVFKSQHGRGRELNMSALIAHWEEMLPPHMTHLFLERVGTMPRQGSSSAFKFGFVCGALRMLAAAKGIPVTYVTPQVWKGSLKIPRDKDVARARATELFPKYSGLFERKKDDGVAEAALIAYYGFHTYWSAYSQGQDTWTSMLKNVDETGRINR